MGKIIFRKKYDSILRQIKKEVLKKDIELDVNQAKKIIAKTIIHVLDIEGEEINHSK